MMNTLGQQPIEWIEGLNYMCCLRDSKMNSVRKDLVLVFAYKLALRRIRKHNRLEVKGLCFELSLPIKYFLNMIVLNMEI